MASPKGLNFMNTTTRSVYIMVGCAIACLLTGASVLAAQDDCKALAKAEGDAFSKLHNTPAPRLHQHEDWQPQLYLRGDLCRWQYLWKDHR